MFSVVPSAPAKDAISGPAYYKPLESRPPLAAVPYEGNKCYDKAVEQVSRCRPPHPSEDHVAVKAEELWTFLPSSPNPSVDPALSYRNYNSSPTLDWLHNSNSVIAFSRATRGEKRTQVLEWACARMEKRRRTCDVPDDSSQSDTTEDIHSISGSPSPSLNGPDIDHMPTGTPHIFIPPEYRAAFSPDIILGASLLLTFKNSTGHQ